MDQNNGSYGGKISTVKLSFPFLRVAGKAATLLVSATLSVMPPSPVMASQSLSPPVKGKQVLDGEVSRIFLKARRLESEGDFQEAQRLYEEVISVEPTFIYSWANLGNVLVSEGTLNQALLCYKKAISLQPPKEQLGVILLNKASLELSIGDLSIAISAWYCIAAMTVLQSLLCCRRLHTGIEGP
jgi:tetratricopeptide (TPR) repeat protein